MSAPRAGSVAWATARVGAVAALLGLLAACFGAPSVPRATRQLRSVPLVSTADTAAADLADDVADRLQEWSDDAARRRESGEELPADDPILDGRAAAEIERLAAARALAESVELEVMLESLARAQEKRLAILARLGKFKVKRYQDANAEVIEIAFGVRRWRSGL